MPIIPALQRLKQEDQESKANISYIGGSCQQRNKQEIIMEKIPNPRIRNLDSNPI
jgi:hypothetical protein